MINRHIAFVVESAHGHINPTLGITEKLVQRGYRVTYAVTDYFAPRVIACGAEAMLYRPMETKQALFCEMQRNKGLEFEFDSERVDFRPFAQLHQQELEDTLSQLEGLYQNDKPNLIIYDRSNLPGKFLALKWNIPAIEHCPMMIDVDNRDDYDTNLVIVSLPKLFQKNAEKLDMHFHFVGPIYNDVSVFKPWRADSSAEKTVLISATTGLLPQVEFYSIAIRAFEDLPWRIVLSIGDELDPASLGPLPTNCEINQFSSQRRILECCCLFIGQGGPASIFEALRCGVPVLLIPPSRAHDIYARRVEELGVGIRLLRPTVSATSLRDSAESLLEDRVVMKRVKQIQQAIGETNAAEKAANLIDQYIDLSGRGIRA